MKDQCHKVAAQLIGNASLSDQADLFEGTVFGPSENQGGLDTTIGKVEAEAERKEDSGSRSLEPYKSKRQVEDFAREELKDHTAEGIFDEYRAFLGRSSFFFDSRRDVRAGFHLAMLIRLRWSLYPSETYRQLMKSLPSTIKYLKGSPAKPGLSIAKALLRPEDSNQSKTTSFYGRVLDFAFDQQVALDDFNDWLAEKPLKARVQEASRSDPDLTPRSSPPGMRPWRF